MGSIKYIDPKATYVDGIANPFGSNKGWKKKGNTCKCGKEGQSLHSCPYEADINDNSETQCNCCTECTQTCADDI